MKKNKLLRFMSNIIFYIVLVMLLSISFVMIKSVKDDEQPTIMGQKFFTVLTGSMEPTINIGDLIVVKEVSEDDIKVGDIITFSSIDENSIVTHRVKDIINEDGKVRYITQGDANNVEDQNPVDSSNVIGKVGRWIPKVGASASWMKSNLKLIIVLVFVITFMVVIWSRVINKFKSYNEEETNNKEKLDL